MALIERVRPIYIYDNEDILLELDGSNNITARYTHGPGIDEPLILERSGASFFYHADGLTSITDITNQAGTVVQRYTYSSFGKIESQLDPNFVQPYTFTAREFDPETGLYYYRARYYDPGAGRFVQEDPIGFAGGVNLYRYVRNSPVNLTDPLGLREICIPWFSRTEFVPTDHTFWRLRAVQRIKNVPLSPAICWYDRVLPGYKVKIPQKLCFDSCNLAKGLFVIDDPEGVRKEEPAEKVVGEASRFAKAILPLPGGVTGDFVTCQPTP